MRRTLLPIAAALALMTGLGSPAAAQNAEVDPQIFDKSIAERRPIARAWKPPTPRSTCPIIRKRASTPRRSALIRG